MTLEAVRNRVERLLRGRYGDAVRVAEFAPLAGDASTRSYARARVAGGEAPATVVVMMLADRGVAISSDELAVLPEMTELPFLNVHRFLDAIGVSVPAVYVDGSREGLVLLEDVGDLALRDAAAASEADAERLYRAAIDQLLRIQIEGTKRADEGCIAFHQQFDARLYDWEFEHFIEFGIERRLGALPPQTAASLRAVFRRISARLDREPRYLNHRDYHGWNLFVQDGRIRVLDFQDALLAAAPYDLATLLGDRDTPSVITPALEGRLLDYYRQAWAAAGGSRWSADHLAEVYYLCALQKAFKVVGRFHYLDLVKGKKGYLRYLPPTVHQIARLLPLVPDGAEIGALLAPYFPEFAP